MDSGFSTMALSLLNTYIIESYGIIGLIRSAGTQRRKEHSPSEGSRIGNRGAC
jgi:hypothetical protein